MAIDMKTEHNTRITSSELGTLWSAYMSESMLVCVLKFFVAKTQDTEMLTIFEFALRCSETRVQNITDFYKQIKHPIPVGFTNEDVNVKAPALYSDIYALNYAHSLSRIAMGTYSLYVSASVNSTVLEIFRTACRELDELYVKTLNLLLSKGLFYRAAAIPIPEQIEFIQKQNYLTGWFGERRPMHAVEIMQLYYNIQRNGIGKCLLLGFSQVAESPKVRDYMVRGINLATKNIQDMAKILSQENVNVSPTWDSEVLNSTIAPFSDKLMMYHVSQLGAISLGLYGAAMGSVTRRDIAALFARMIKDAALYAEDGMNLMIDNEWMEKPPHSIDNIDIAKRKD
jgi:hypothetical protein